MEELDTVKKTAASKGSQYQLTGLAVVVGLLLAASIVSFWKFGSYLSPDTLSYLRIIHGFPNLLSSLSPFYPFLLAQPPLSYLPLFDKILVANLIAVGLSFWVVYKIALKAGKTFPWVLFSFGLSLLSWWSFRVLGSAHADSLFYALLVLWLYLFIWGDQRENHYFPAIAILSALLIWVKLNALFLFPFLLIWSLISRNKSWLLVALATLVSWACYQWTIPENILHFHVTQREGNGIWPALYLFYENLATWMQVTLGLIISDTLSQYIPRALAFALGVCWIGFLGVFLIFHQRKRENKLYSLLLFGSIYSLFFLTLQQWAGFREVNYRTLFPYLLVISWALWIVLIRNEKKRLLLVLAILIAGHTLIGHLLLWQRDRVASLTEAKSFHNSLLKDEISSLLTHKQVTIRTDHPEKLMLSFMDREVIPLDPAFRFVDGKNEAVSPTERKEEKEIALASVREGKEILVIFEPDSFWENVAENESLNALVEDGVLILVARNLPK
ncbi:hypothetical protein [Cyclobacterium jeungdonense]|uniref:Glycosyltransferase RgtA/B/C/D-like domain-containing protein n=1 Tax=Cyclobacterium jeungdonense TaxID=708087 RepID=A0ABT8C1A4_9BACT|nr:hypothetical protein [Cyclobacterium jeungdonense]MDN3686573.1 hypothetical protein [Cyclobacterium jeungdonense]